MDEEITKTCKKHGVLKREDINIRIRKNPNPRKKTKAEWVEKICSLCKKEKDKIDYNNKNRFEIRKNLKNIVCHLCKEDLLIDNFTDTGLKSKYPYCRDCVRASSRKTYRKSYLTKRYGIDQKTYDEMKEKQNNLCAICEKPESRIQGYSKTPHGLCVDHDHITGKIRGLLCHLCNSAIGKLNDSPSLLRKAANYLDMYNAT